MLRLWQPDKIPQIQCENFSSLHGWGESPEKTWEGTGICCLPHDPLPLSSYLIDTTFVISWTESLCLLHTLPVVSFYPMGRNGCIFLHNRLLGLVQSQQSVVCKPPLVLWIMELLCGSRRDLSHSLLGIELPLTPTSCQNPRNCLFLLVAPCDKFYCD